MRRSTRTSRKLLSKVSLDEFENQQETAVHLEIPDEKDKLPDGSISIEADNRLSSYKWNKIKMSCSECGVSSENPFDLKNHYQESHSELNGMEKYECNFCDPPVTISFFNKFLNHVTASHNTCLKYW